MKTSSIFFPPSIRAARRAAIVGSALLLCACAAPPTAQFDYTAFRESRPRSILVMPPINKSPEINATASFLTTSTVPLAESGYYVIPVTLSEETFKQNGVTVAEEAHALELGKLREIFGADAALYLTVISFGSSYRVVSSVVEVAAAAKLVDLRSGQELWSSQVFFTSGSSSSGGLIGMLISAAVSQIGNTVSDKSHDVGRRANYRMLSAGHPNGILYGPYRAEFGTD